MIDVQNLSRFYGEKAAVKGVSFSVAPGVVWGFLGPNGAGKTTTMRMITGYIAPSEGSVRVAGFDVVSQSESVKERIGYLPETPPLYDEMTVGEYLGFAASLRGVKGKNLKSRVGYAMERTGLKGVAGSLIRNLSKGYRQRVGIAQALVHNPPVLILDEPTVGLDPAQIVEIRELIRSLKGEHTVILSTHILSEVTQVCDGAAIINEGTLYASGTLEEIEKCFSGPPGLYIESDPLPSPAELMRVEGISGVRREGAGLHVAFGDEEAGIKALNLWMRREERLLKEWRPIRLTLEEIYLRALSRERGVKE